VGNTRQTPTTLGPGDNTKNKVQALARERDRIHQLFQRVSPLARLNKVVTTAFVHKKVPVPAVAPEWAQDHVAPMNTIRDLL
jgi:hypothetical protein